MNEINGTTANYPGKIFFTAVDLVLNYNKCKDVRKIQICPQQSGIFSDFMAQKFIEKYRQINFRLHANVRLENEVKIFDASKSLTEEKYKVYCVELKKRIGILKSDVYSYHAGRRNCSLEQMLDNKKKLEDYIKTEVAIEGLYPNYRDEFLISSINEYEWLAEKSKFALELSHIQIVFKKEKKEIDICWVRDLVHHKNCVEIHISTNDGVHDSHEELKGDEWFIDMLRKEKIKADIFSEENLLKNTKI